MTMSNLNTNKLLPQYVSPSNADFSNAATGTYSSGGFNYKYITFSASGTLTVTQSGVADVVVVGGGGGAGSQSGIVGGGGAGQLVAKTIDMTAATHTITIGAGGTTLTPVGNQGNKTSLGTLVSAGGGGGGLGSVNNRSNVYPTWGHAGGHAGGIVIFSSAAGRNGMGTDAAGANEYSGTISGITGSSVTYGEGGNSTSPATAGSGGWSTGPGNGGVVIVRVKV